MICFSAIKSNLSLPSAQVNDLILMNLKTTPTGEMLPLALLNKESSIKPNFENWDNVFLIF